ncbi:hypothetical protein DSM3645_26184 [Blastopirellula marina DSM 3645]|uniref:Uncharacterized protein n=1 Tax=Blastopirellula marina DSM 3645 TaxID=314230 RepID=A3ZWF0_9BACT|nr:hypothetical protein DSM3645_26184 [Blastopirellula marina DSM 3645]
MDRAIYDALKRLKVAANGSDDSEVPEWLRERVTENVSKLIEENASNRKVAEKLTGGLRAIMDASSPSDDDPLICQMISIIEVIELVSNEE